MAGFTIILLRADLLKKITYDYEEYHPANETNGSYGWFAITPVLFDLYYKEIVLSQVMSQFYTAELKSYAIKCKSIFFRKWIKFRFLNYFTGNRFTCFSWLYRWLHWVIPRIYSSAYSTILISDLPKDKWDLHGK